MASHPSHSSVLFLGRNFAKFQPEKYDFNLCKRFFMKKMVTNSPDFAKKKNPNSPDFYAKFQVGSQ
jgi:hypothetical protein